MIDLDEALRQNRTAADGLLAAADAALGNWTQPRAPGKWSPSQVVEHVARALEQSAKELRGEPSLFPKFPGLVQPVMRGLFFNWIIRRGSFPRGTKTNAAMDPAHGSVSPAEARVRVNTALRDLEQSVTSRPGGAQPVHSGAFGPVALPEYLIFQAIHTRHHTPQITAKA